MTDKQIIIDGVDVSGCSSFDKKTGHCLTGFRTDEEPFCNCFTCYYKQLKRKEQECNMWENIAVENGAVALKYQQQIDQLKEENDELKQRIKEQAKELWDKTTQIRNLTKSTGDSICEEWVLDMLGY